MSDLTVSRSASKPCRSVVRHVCMWMPISRTSTITASASFSSAIVSVLFSPSGQSSSLFRCPTSAATSASSLFSPSSGALGPNVASCRPLVDGSAAPSATYGRVRR